MTIDINLLEMRSSLTFYLFYLWCASQDFLASSSHYDTLLATRCKSFVRQKICWRRWHSHFGVLSQKIKTLWLYRCVRVRTLINA